VVGQLSVAKSLHQRILDDVEGRILSGEFPPGARIATEHELAARYGCSRMTVSKVLTQLAHAGLVERRRRAGTFVRRPGAQSALLEVSDIRAEALALNRTYRFKLIRKAVRRGGHGFIDSKVSGPLLEVVVCHFAGHRAFCLEDRLINLHAVPAAETQTFEEVSPGQWLLDTVLWTEAEHRIQAGGATRIEAAQLGIATGAACLKVERRAWRGNTPITKVRLAYPGDAHQLVARLTPSRRSNAAHPFSEVC
jgi:GntR family histidine utilization transcriptional repressor